MEEIATMTAATEVQPTVEPNDDFMNDDGLHWGITCSECLDSDCPDNPELQEYDDVGCTGYGC